MAVEKKFEMGDRIRECRKQKKMSQADLAEAIGVSDNTISNIETGCNNVKLENIVKLTDFFEVSLDYLVNGIGQSYVNDDFIRTYQELSESDKEKMRIMMNTFFPKTVAS